MGGREEREREGGREGGREEVRGKESEVCECNTGSTNSSSFLQREAKGKLYIDDGHSNDYLNRGFVVREFEFNRYKFTSRYFVCVM